MFSTNQDKADEKFIGNRNFSYGTINQRFQKKYSHYVTTKQHLREHFLFYDILRNVAGVIKK